MGSDALKQALGYLKFKGQIRLLILDTGYMVVKDIVDGAQDLGWSVLKVSAQGKGIAAGDFIANLLKALVVYRPDFVITVNHLGFDEQGVLAGLLDTYQMPTASWFVDHPLPILGPAGDNTSAVMQVFSFERTALSWLAERGYSDPVYLPTGANKRHFHPEKIDAALAGNLSCDLSFVGNSWWSKARIEPSSQIRKAVEKVGRERRVDKRSLLLGFEEQIVKKFPGNKRERYAAAQVLLAEASVQKRRSFARALMPVKIRIFGDPHWVELAPEIDLKPPVDYQRGLPALFSSCRVNANVTAEQMPTAVNQRVWDVPAVGGFLLTDDQEDALEFFVKDEEIAVYTTVEEAADKARYYLANETARQQIARRANEIVDRQHCITHRLSTMVDVMRRRFG